MIDNRRFALLAGAMVVVLAIVFLLTPANAQNQTFFISLADSGVNADCEQYDYWAWIGTNTSVLAVREACVYVNTIGAPSGMTVTLNAQSAGGVSSSNISTGTLSGSCADNTWCCTGFNSTANMTVPGGFYVKTWRGGMTAANQLCNHWNNVAQSSVSGTAHRGYNVNNNVTTGLIMVNVSYALGGGAGSNSTQTADIYGDTYTDIAGEDQAGNTNATHFNEAFHWQYKVDSAIGLTSAEVWVKNVSGGNYYLHYNDTTPQNATAENSTAWTAPAGTEEGLCVYVLARAVNGTQAYSNSTDCDYMSFYDDVAPTVTATSPADATDYELGTRPDLEGQCADDYLLNCTGELYWQGNGTRAAYESENAGAGVTYLDLNSTSHEFKVGDYYWNVSGMDSHTGEEAHDSKE